ncbi:MAG TPA: HNH endonuclease signature motif containing protein [Pyrinomonadaceae bacterium]|nr:HNH endonuclease signature motif containing protein [Pyrinomonadaceae bacterium]
MQRILDRHLVELIPIYDDHNPRRLPYSYFLDVSVFRRNYSALLSREMLTWHLTTSRFSKDLSVKHGRRLIRRVLPIARREYTEEEIRLIKYNLHFQLGLGLEILVMFVDENFLPESQFGSDNLALVKGRVRITSSRPYDTDAPADIVVTPGSDSEVGDLYLHLESLNAGDKAIGLSYNDQTFTGFNLSGLKKRYGSFLYTLQSGCCGLTGESLDVAPWDVDHVIPIAMGGNNSLVNLQAARHASNVSKGARIEDFRYALSPLELAKHRLTTTYHRRLSDRTLMGAPLGPDALHHLDPKSL